jgi:hypothetical protein
MNGNAPKKLLEKMRDSPYCWGQTDKEHLLKGFGFRWREGKHRIYFHSIFKDLTIGVPRHNTLKEWVARDAVKLIDELIERTNNEAINGKLKENY